MKLRGNELNEKAMMHIKDRSVSLANYLYAEGCETDVLTFLLEEEQPENYETLLKEGANLAYCKLLKAYPDQISKDFIFTAIRKQMSAEKLEDIFKGDNEVYEINSLIDQYNCEDDKIDTDSNVEDEFNNQYNQENIKSSDINSEDNNISPEQKHVDCEIEIPQKNMFTQTLEDLLGESIDDLQEQEESDEDLEKLVNMATMAIANDKRKTNVINNLKRIIIVANRHINHTEQQCAEHYKNENGLQLQMNQIIQERDYYKKQYEGLNKKIKELTSLSSGIGMIEAED